METKLFFKLLASRPFSFLIKFKNISSVIMGATKPKQVKDNAKASGIKLSADVLRAIDDALGNVAARDPNLTESPKPRA